MIFQSCWSYFCSSGPSSLAWRRWIWWGSCLNHLRCWCKYLVFFFFFFFFFFFWERESNHNNYSRLARYAYDCWQGAAFSLWLITGSFICLNNLFVLKKSELLLANAWQFQTCPTKILLKFLYRILFCCSNVHTFLFLHFFFLVQPNLRNFIPISHCFQLILSNFKVIGCGVIYLFIFCFVLFFFN